MKPLISPPIQGVFWLGGVICLALAAWSIINLRMMDEETVATGSVQVDIPDVAALQVPSIQVYRRLVNTPLFWESRSVPKYEPPPVAKAQPQPVRVRPPQPVSEPEGRLVGIIDPGTDKYAVVRTENEKLSLHEGDEWDGWAVEKIADKGITLSTGAQRHEVLLVADFSAPNENKQLARKRQEQQRLAALRQRQQQNRAARQAEGTDENAGVIPVLEPALEDGEVPENAETTPIMSIREALEARKRLMAERWGGEQQKGGASGGAGRRSSRSQ